MKWKTILCLCILPMLTGCAAIQVRERTYLQAIELKNMEHSIIQLHEFESESEAIETNGDSVSEALTQASVLAGKELFFGHLELIAYHDASFGTNFDAFMENYRLSPSCRILWLSEDADLSQTDTSLLVEQLQQAEKNGVLPETNLFTILQEFSGNSGTALIPALNENGFSAVIVTESEFCGTLSEAAITGLCWIRGDNYPSQITLPDHSVYTVQSATVRLTADMQENHTAVTIHIRIKGEGDLDSAANVIKSQCRTAIAETVNKYQADVFDLEACLQSQCYRYVTDTDWETVLSETTFSILVEEIGY